MRMDWRYCVTTTSVEDKNLLMDGCSLALWAGKILYHSMVVAILLIVHVQMIVAIFKLQGALIDTESFRQLK